MSYHHQKLSRLSSQLDELFSRAADCGGADSILQDLAGKEVLMDSRKRKFPVTLMLDSDRLAKLEALSRGSDESMSRLIRLSVDQLVERLGGPDCPDMNALAEMLRATD